MNTKKTSSLRTRLALRALAARQKLKDHFTDCGGEDEHTNRAGYVVLGLTLIAVIIVWAVPYTRETLLPLIGQKIQGIFDYGS